MIVDRFGTVLSFYVLYYCIIIQYSSYLATWLPFLINRLDWIGYHIVRDCIECFFLGLSLVLDHRGKLGGKVGSACDVDTEGGILG